MYKMLKHKEKELQGGDAIMMLQQSEGSKSFPRPRRKVVLLLRQTMSCCMFLLQSKEQGI